MSLRAGPFKPPLEAVFLRRSPDSIGCLNDGESSNNKGVPQNVDSFKNIDSNKDNDHSFNDIRDSHNTTITYNNYGTIAPSDIPGTLRELVAGNHWGVSPPEIDLDYLQDSYNLPDTGTGEWIFKEDGYKNWQESEKSEILWLRGGSGTGKTMLARKVAAEFLPGPRDPRNGVKLVYCFLSPEPLTDGASADEAETPKRRFAKVTWDILYGILQQDSNLFHACKAELEIQGDRFFTNPSSLWKVIRSAIQDYPGDTVYILIDGADGLGKDLCGELIGRILPLMYIRKINIDKNGCVEADVGTFIEGRVSAFKEWTNEQRAGAIGKLLKKSEGNFLWASLAVRDLKDSCTGPGYEAFLEKIPPKFEAVYQKMLRDVQSQHGSEEVLGIIRSVALALRPLTLGEFGYILACMEDEPNAARHPPPGGTGPKIQPKTEGEVMQYVRSSWSFLRATSTHVSIIHHTAIEYLFGKDLQESAQALIKCGLELEVSWHCFRYIHDAIEDIERSHERNDKGRKGKFRQSGSKGDQAGKPAGAPQELRKNRQQGAVADWPYLKYAAESWFLHARRSIEISTHGFCQDPPHNWLEYQFFLPGDVIRKPWIAYCGDPKMEVLAGGQTPLHIAVCLGLMPLVEKTLPDLSSRSGGTSSQSPLHLAARFISGVYKILIKNGDSSVFTSRGQYGNTPVHEAVISGHWNMLKALVEKLATLDSAQSDQINEKNDYGDTPLHLAVQFDHTDIVKFLVEKGADPTIENKRRVTSLKLGEDLERQDILAVLKRAAETKEKTRKDPKPEPGAEIGEEPGVMPGEFGEPGAEYGEGYGEKPSKEPGEELRGGAEEPGEEPAEEPEEGLREEPAEELREGPREELGQEPREELGEGPGEGPRKELGEGPGEEIRKKPTEEPRGESQEDSGDESGEESGEGFEEESWWARWWKLWRKLCRKLWRKLCRKLWRKPWKLWRKFCRKLRSRLRRMMGTRHTS